MTDDQTALLVKAKDSVRAAGLLARDGLYDFAVSRAYYTMLYAAKAETVALARPKSPIPSSVSTLASTVPTGAKPTLASSRYFVTTTLVTADG